MPILFCFFATLKKKWICWPGWILPDSSGAGLQRDSCYLVEPTESEVVLQRSGGHRATIGSQHAAAGQSGTAFILLIMHNQLCQSSFHVGNREGGAVDQSLLYVAISRLLLLHTVL